MRVRGPRRFRRGLGGAGRVSTGENQMPDTTHGTAIPRHSMYAIYAYIDPSNHPNVGKYTIHGVSGIYAVKCRSSQTPQTTTPGLIGSPTAVHVVTLGTQPPNSQGPNHREFFGLQPPPESGGADSFGLWHPPSPWDVVGSLNIYRMIWHQSRT